MIAVTMVRPNLWLLVANIGADALRPPGAGRRSRGREG